LRAYGFDNPRKRNKDKIMKKNTLAALLFLFYLGDISAIPDCAGDVDFYNCFGSKTWGKDTVQAGDRYVGEWLNDRPHGQGIYKWKNGSEYVGEFSDGKPNGKGTLRYANGQLYIGSFSNNKYHGNGSLSYLNGDFYEGNWALGKRSGHGKLTYKNGSEYVGNFLNNMLNGMGTYTVGGDKYIGAFKNGKKSGKGKAVGYDGVIVDGIWDNDEYIGTQAEIDYKIKRDKQNAIRREKELARLAKLEKEEKEKQKYNKIYINCLLDKSKGIDMQVSILKKAIEDSCNSIAENPSLYQNIKYFIF
jgi:hypothetical protein